MKNSNENIINISMCIQGEARVIVYNKDGSVDKDTGWVDNTITDYGLRRALEDGWATYLHIGSDNTATDVTQSTLNTWIAYSNDVTSTVGSNSGSPNYNRIITRSLRFDDSNTYTVQEIGLSPSNTNINMCTRLVIPAITKDTDQVLDVYYRITEWPSLAEPTGTITIAELGEDYDYLIKRSRASYAPYSIFRRFGLDISYVYCYTADVSADILGMPSNTPGSDESPSSQSTYNYTTDLVAETSSCDRLIVWDITRDTSSNGIRSVNIPIATNSGYSSILAGFQIRFGRTSDDIKIPKTDRNQFKLVVRFTLGRH